MLQRAHQLTKKLEAHLHLLPPYEVPYALPLTTPPVSVEFLACDLRGIEVKDHVGFGLRRDRDIVVPCLLGLY
jgi:hypothetical protein